MIDENLILGLGSQSEELIHQALRKIPDQNAVEYEEASILVNLIAPLSNSENSMTKNLANEAFASLKVIFPTLELPNRIQSSAENVTNHLPKIVLALLSGSSESDVVQGLRKVNDIKKIDEPEAQNLVDSIVSFLQSSDSISNKMLARSAIGQLKILSPNVALPEALFPKSKPQAAGSQNSKANHSSVNYENAKSEIVKDEPPKDTTFVGNPSRKTSWNLKPINIVTIAVLIFLFYRIFLSSNSSGPTIIPEAISFSKTISGGAWVKKGGGQSDILRGQEIVFLKEDAYQKIKEVRNEEYRKSKSEFGILGDFWHLKLDSMVLAAVPYLVKSAKTDVDGKYTITLDKGRYYAFSVYETNFSKAYWLFLIEVDNSTGQVNFDNSNMTELFNK